MILIEFEPGEYARLSAALLKDSGGKTTVQVKDKDEVLAILQNNPDKEFSLESIPEFQRAQLAQKPDWEKVVFCGRVKWDSKMQKLVNVKRNP